jgi:hypothetical protein
LGVEPGTLGVLLGHLNHWAEGLFAQYRIHTLPLD